MLLVLAPGASREDAERVLERARRAGHHARLIGEPGRQAVTLAGGPARPDRAELAGDPAVLEVDDSPNPCFLALRRCRPEDTVVDVGGIPVGGRRLVLMAGPCAVESRAQLFGVAERLKKCGVSILRGGAYKLRTSPWSFQGLEGRGLELLGAVRRETGMRVVTEVVSETTLGAVAEVADLLQVGARNMKNYALLKEVGRASRPVLLKRGPDALVSEWLLSAEYLLAEGCPGVILCERGIRTFGDHLRNTLDLGVVPVIKKLSHLPVLVDPSHGAGRRELVPPLARAAVAVGADGLLVEVHPHPEEALSDGPQALRPEDFECLTGELQGIARVLGRVL